MSIAQNEKNVKTLVVIDGKSVFYRGYYAMGALALADGMPTGGVYGFASIAMELIARIRPDKVVVAWDKAKTSISKRKAIYAEYKAGRAKPPEDFYTQIPLLRELIDALGWAFVERDNFEADDIIGTLALQADEDLDEQGRCKWETIIISSDLDMLQIVDDNTRMYRLLKGFSELEEIDVAAVEKKYGILKSQFLDLKALKGDASDNIPGVPGIGEKGAVKLLNEYGSLDGIYEHIDEIKGAVHDKLVAGKASAYMSQKLAKIMFDAPVQLADLPELIIDKERITAELKKLEFNSLIRKFSKVLEDHPATPQQSANLSSNTLAQEDEITTATQNLPEGLIVEDDVKAAMHKDPALAEKILQGAEFWDLNQGQFLLDPLKRKEQTTGQTKLDSETREEKAQRQATEFWRQKREFQTKPELYTIFTAFDLPLIPVLYEMEQTGIKISREYFAKLLEEYQAYVTRLEQKICQVAGVEFNINSPLQLSQVLFEKLGLSTQGIKKKQRGYSTGVKELEKLRNEHAIIPMIMEYREAAKLLSTYIMPLPTLADKNDRIHTTFTQDVTATGRLSSINPNLQNIPVRTEEGKRIRTGFVSEEGKSFVSADYSQFELRLAAVLAGDTGLIADFNSGIDIHTKTAADVFGVPMDIVTKNQRRAAKVINFGVLYGMSAKGLADAAGMSITEAKQFIDDYFKVRRPIRDYLDKILRQAKEVGYVETYFGRRRPTPDVKSASFLIRAAAERAAENMPIQGTEADLMKRAMVKIQKKLPEGAKLILQVHDSLIIECDDEKVPEVSQMLQDTMEHIAPELAIKLAVEVTTGKNWGKL